LRRAIFLAAAHSERKEFGMKSNEGFLWGSSEVYFLHRLGVVDHDEALRLPPIHATHQDNTIILFTPGRVGHEYWFSGEESVRQLFDDETAVLHVEFDHGTVQIENVLAHVGELVRLSQIGGIDVGELEGAVNFHLDKVLDLRQIPGGHVDGISLDSGPVVWVRLATQHHVNIGEVVIRTGIEVLQHVEVKLIVDVVLVGAQDVGDEEVRYGHLSHQAAVS